MKSLIGQNLGSILEITFIKDKEVVRLIAVLSRQITTQSPIYLFSIVSFTDCGNFFPIREEENSGELMRLNSEKDVFRNT